MKAKVISQPNRAEGEPPRSTKYALPIALTFGSALLTQCVEASIVNKNISYVAQDIRVFSNETSDLSAQDKTLLQNYTTSASLLLNKLGEAGSLLFSPKDMSVYQYQGKNADGNTNNVEFAVNNISVNDQLSEQDTGKSIISFRNDNVAPTGEFDISTKSFLFDPQLPQTFIRTETTDHTVITVQGAELNKTVTPFMIIVLDKLPADVDINKALQDPELAREVTMINPVTGESIIIPQDQDVIATEQANSSPSLINMIGKIIEPSGVVQAQGSQSEAPTAIPPAPVEVAPGEFIPASQIVGYEARDTSGKLIYVQDTKGDWIKATHEVAAPVADWAGVNERLGTEFTINPDGTIAGVEGLNINMANGEATFNFDGKGTEVYHIGNIKVQEIDGVKRLLVAGYSWNAETTSWEVFNPGFPMESPEAQLGWFMEADVANGNWLRWHQRALVDLATQGGFVKPDGTADVESYMKDLFKDAFPPDKWLLSEISSSGSSDIDGDGKGDFAHLIRLRLNSSEFAEILANGEPFGKEHFPGRAGLSFSFLADADAAIISFEALNGDGSVTSLPAMIDAEHLWRKIIDNITGKEIKTTIFRRLASAFGIDPADTEGDNINSTSWMIWLSVSAYEDATFHPWLYGRNLQIFKDPESSERKTEAVNNGKIEQSASLELWGGGIAAVRLADKLVEPKSP